MSTPTPAPEPWMSRKLAAPVPARVLAAIHAQREGLLACYPRVAVGGFGLAGFANSGPLPVGVLITLWDREPVTSGPCPDCGGLALALVFACIPNRDLLYGDCTGCGHGVYRVLDGLQPRCYALVRAAATACGVPVEDGRGQIVGVPGAVVHDWRPILAVLGELGVDGLPRTLKDGRLSHAARPRRPYA